MNEELKIHVKYGSYTSIILTKRSEFLKKISTKYQIKEEDIEIINSKTSQKIDVHNLKDFLQVEILKKRKENNSRLNNGPSSSHDGSRQNVDLPQLCDKLMGVTILTKPERTFLCNTIQSLPIYFRERIQRGDFRPIETKNRKIQAHPVDEKFAQTQTDLEVAPAGTTWEATTNDLTGEIKRHAKRLKPDPQKTAQLMTASFRDRRNFILLKRPMVQLVKEEYPLLFNLKEVRNELERIFTIGKCSEFLTNVEQYAEIILTLPSSHDSLLKTIQEKVKSYTTPQQKKYAIEVGSILLLSQLAGEQRSFLKLMDESLETQNQTYVACEARLKDLFFDQHVFKIITESVLICEAYDFKEGILCLMATFFIFNIQYPDSCFNTLYIMEKIYLEAMDTEETDIEDNIKQVIKTLELKLKTKQRKL